MQTFAQHRHRESNSLAAKAHLLDVLLAYSPDRIFFKDLESRFIAVSQGLVRYFGVQDQSEVLGRTDFDFFGAEHARAAFEDERIITQTQVPIVNKMEREDLSDGRIRWAQTTKLPMLNEEGLVIGTFGVSRDFTSEKELEDRLAGERNLLRSVIDHIPDPIYVKNQRGAYVLDNQSHRAFLGIVSENEIVGKTSYHFFPKKQARKFEQDDADTLEKNVPMINRAEKATSPNGTDTWLLTTKVPVTGPNNSENLLICIGRNVTEQKLAEEQLLKTNTELLAALDNLKKAHEELRDVQLQLIESERLKSVGRLAAGVAHEVKNPLAVLSLGLELLRQNIPATDEESCLVISEMSEAVKRADTVVKGLLDFSVPAQINQTVASFNATVLDALRFFRGKLKASAVKVVTDLAPDAPSVRMDRQKMEQVLVNLFMNAAQSMEKKGGTLCIATRREQLTGIGSNVADVRAERFRVGDWLLVVEVNDTGAGVPPDRLDQVFKPFFTTKATGSGTGLGLSVCKTIIDLHGGTISLKNRSKGGACVTISLPEAKTKKMKQKHILVIDDEVGFTRLLKLTLEKTGLYLVRVENNPTNALQAAREFLPELILLDVIMPDADGGDVAARFASDSIFQKIPIIFLTAMVSPEDQIPGNTIGGYPYIAKPVSPPDLIRAIERGINKYRLEKQGIVQEAENGGSL